MGQPRERAASTICGGAVDGDAERRQCLAEVAVADVEVDRVDDEVVVLRQIATASSSCSG